MLDWRGANRAVVDGLARCGDADARMRECRRAHHHQLGHAIWVEAGRRRLVRRRDVNPRRRTSSLLWIGFASVTGVCLCIIGSICAFFFFLFSSSFLAPFLGCHVVIFAKIHRRFFRSSTWRARQSQRPDAAGPISVITTRSNTARRRVCRVWSSGALLREMQRDKGSSDAPSAFLHRAVDVPTLCAPPPTQPQCGRLCRSTTRQSVYTTAPHCTFGDHHTLERHHVADTDTASRHGLHVLPPRRRSRKKTRRWQRGCSGFRTTMRISA